MRFGGQSCLMRSIKVSGVVTSLELRVFSACNTSLTSVQCMILLKSYIPNVPSDIVPGFPECTMRWERL